MKTTPYFDDVVLIKRPYVTVEACEAVISNHTKKVLQNDGRIRYWGKYQGKWLRVVVENNALHNAFFDRRFKP